MEFRKRFSEEDMAAILEASVPAPEKKDDEEDNDPPNGGTLILDATCCPADIAYPQDINLLNQAREKLEHTVDEICKSTGRKKPRMYRQRARRDFLRLSKSKKPVQNMSIWRVDLMTEITIPSQGRCKPGKGVPALDKRKVENLPAKWDEEFHHSHLNMSFDKPVPVWLRVSSVTVPAQGAEKTVVNYTFLHDWFGDHFQYIRTEKGPPYADIVRVECSPYAMANWAMQYSDRVEVLKPKEVRDAVIKKIQAMNQKYQVEPAKKGK